ncbi:MAG: 3-dehydroquinate synthase [Clostridia bacterium]|nr:3-dehydroquinate synthase [Clostridia bacterium]
MKQVHVSASREYDILIGSGLIKNAGALIKNVSSARKCLIVSDDNVYPVYGEALLSQLTGSGMTVFSHVVPHGESSKNADNYFSILERLAELGFTRSDCVVALGGGVVGDLAGFAAATYMRGIDIIQMPTSLLAAVDASVGGKTAINLKQGKNLAGCFCQPKAVIIDTDTLSCLPEKEYFNGCAEIIKYGMIADSELMKSIMSSPVKDNYEDIIFRCVDIKRGFVENDEHDTGCRMLLNFGHTLGHAFEKLSSYTLPHGFAVAIGMAYITRAAYRQGLCEKDISDTLTKALDKYCLPKFSDYPAEDVARAALTDKKADGCTISLIVPTMPGKCEIKKIPSSELSNWVKAGEAHD